MTTKKHINLLYQLKNFLYLNKAIFKYLSQFLFVVLIYGVLINFSLSQLITFEFSIKNIIAIGIASYLIKVELPPLIASCFPKSPPQIIQ